VVAGVTTRPVQQDVLFSNYCISSKDFQAWLWLLKFLSNCKSPGPYPSKVRPHRHPRPPDRRIPLRIPLILITLFTMPEEGTADSMTWRWTAIADSADPDQPFRPILITDSGDRDHVVLYA
jgi:hypothetical protein